jgi:hypothetical protein
MSRAPGYLENRFIKVNGLDRGYKTVLDELPKLTGPELQQIAQKAEFLAGLDEGLRQIAEGKLIAHEAVKAQFKS